MKRFLLQSVATAIVLGGGVATSIAGQPGASSHPSTRAARRPPTPAPSQTFTVPTPPAPAHIPAPKLDKTHPAHEAWARLLPSAPHGFQVIRAATPISRHELSQQFRSPAAVASSLQFDRYSRGVERSIRGTRIGVVEQLWQFARPSGATAWYATYIEANQPKGGSHSLFGHFRVTQEGETFTSGQRDAAGYHFGVGVSLLGDMVVYVRVFSLHSIASPAIKAHLHRANVPVEREVDVRPGPLAVVSSLGSLHRKATAT